MSPRAKPKMLKRSGESGCRPDHSSSPDTSRTLYTDKKEKKIFLKYKEIKRDWVQSHI
jgi:hypothetical protein